MPKGWGGSDAWFDKFLKAKGYTTNSTVST
jgi:hypothetical protein